MAILSAFLQGQKITRSRATDHTLQSYGVLLKEVAFGDFSTSFRATLFIVADRQNITLSLPRELLKRIKRVAADRDTSVSSLMTEALTRLADEDRRYSAARKRALAALRSARSLGTGGRRTWSRDELHER